MVQNENIRMTSSKYNIMKGYVKFENRLVFTTLERISALQETPSGDLEVSEVGWFVNVKAVAISRWVLKEKQGEFQIGSNECLMSS